MNPPGLSAKDIGFLGPIKAGGQTACRTPSKEEFFATYRNAGLRIYDIRNAFEPKQIGYFVPPPPKKNRRPAADPPNVTQSCDVFVAEGGLVCLTDTNAGLYILQYEGS